MKKQSKVGSSARKIHAEEIPQKAAFSILSSMQRGAPSVRLNFITLVKDAQTFLLKLSDTLRSLSDPIFIQQEASRALGEYLQADRTFYAVFDWQRGKARIERDYVRGDTTSLVGEHTLANFTGVTLAFQEGHTLVIGDVADPKCSPTVDLPAYEALSIRSLVSMPLVKEGITVACMSVLKAKPHHWSDLEIFLIEETAERTWAAVERALVEEALHKSAQKYRTLFDSIDEGYCIIQMMHNENGYAYDWRFLEVNRAFEFNNGLSNAAGKTIRELAPTIEPKWMVIYDKVAQTGQPLRFEEDSVALGRVFNLYAFRIGDAVEHKVAVIFTDITEKKRMEKALQESEERFRSLVESYAQAVWETDPSGGVVDDSPTWRAYTGQTLEEWIGVGWLNAIHPEDRPTAERAWRDAIVAKQNVNLEFRLKATPEHYRWTNLRATPLLEEKGNIRKWTAMNIDIHERKTVQQQLQALTLSLEQKVAERTSALLENKNLLQSIFDISLIQMSVLQTVRDADGQVIDFKIMVVNKEVERETGRTDLVGKRYTTEFPFVRTTGLFDQMQEVLKSGAPRQLEYSYPSDTSNQWFSCMVVKLNDGLVVTSLDITERKRAELATQENSYFIERLTIASPDNLFVMNIHTQEAIYTNRSCAEMLGYDERQRAAMKNEVLDPLHPDDLPRALQHIKDMASASDGEVRTIEYRVLDAQGKVRWMHDRNAVFKRDPRGHVLEKLGVTHEITDRKKAEEEVVRLRLQQQKEILNAVIYTQEKERERIGEDLHNDLGQLLYTVKVKCEMLVASNSRDEALLKQIDQLLEESINKTRHISSELVPVMLRDFGIEDGLRAWFPKIITPSLKLYFQVEGLEQRMPEEFEISIYRIVQELVNNVAKHAKATKAYVNIFKKDKYITLEVKDNGIGFNRQQESNSPKGVGLQSIKNRVKLLDGTFSIRATRGTQIKIQLPLE